MTAGQQKTGSFTIEPSNRRAGSAGPGQTRPTTPPGPVDSDIALFLLEQEVQRHRDSWSFDRTVEIAALLRSARRCCRGGRAGAVSWDVLLFDIPSEFASVADIPQGFRPALLGSRAEVEAALRRVVPNVNLTDPTWGVLDGPTWSSELNIGGDDPIDSIMLHVRGGGDDVMTPIFAMASALNCRVLDCSEGDFITPDETAGWHGFQSYRDHVVRTSTASADQ